MVDAFGNGLVGAGSGFAVGEFGKEGVKIFHRYVQLDTAAQGQSDRMAADGSISHRPDFANSYPAGASSSAEIVAVLVKGDGTEAAGQIFDQWAASGEDRAKMTAAGGYRTNRRKERPYNVFIGYKYMHLS